VLAKASLDFLLTFCLKLFPVIFNARYITKMGVLGSILQRKEQPSSSDFKAREVVGFGTRRYGTTVAKALLIEECG